MKLLTFLAWTNAASGASATDPVVRQGLTSSRSPGKKCLIMGRVWVGVLVAVMVCLGGSRAWATGDGTATDLAHRAMIECEAGRRATAREERQSHFEHGQDLAQRAVAADDQSAGAHFALFCNMGELMRLDGESISSLWSLHRLMGELDRTLALDPGNTDALSSKGQLLVRLPRLLGGDVDKGEQMLRQVVQKDPTAFSSRLALARTCEARGNREEALAFTTRALQIARDQGRADKIAEAQAILAELRAER
jgi:tetratricopeptide (TPR) repeat protein